VNLLINALITIPVFLVTFTANFNYVLGLNGNDLVAFSSTGSIICSTMDNNNKNSQPSISGTAHLDLLFGSPGISSFGFYNGNGLSLNAQGIVELEGPATNPTGFIFRGQTFSPDSLCNMFSVVNIEVTGQCVQGGHGTFEVEDGRRGEFTITQIECLDACPSNMVVSAGPYGSTPRQIFCTETGEMDYNATKSKDLTDTGANPADVDASTGHVKPGVIPQPPGDDQEQHQAKSADDSSENVQDTSSSNDEQSDEPSTDNNQSDVCPSNESFDPKLGECTAG